MVSINKGRLRTIITVGAIIETLFLAAAIGLTIFPPTREPGIVALFFAIPTGFWLYGGYIDYVRGNQLLGSELAQGVKWVVLGLILAALLTGSLGLPAWAFFTIPIVFAGAIIGYRVVTRTEPATSPADGIGGRIGFIFSTLVIAVYFVWAYLAGTTGTQDTVVVLGIMILIAFNGYRFWHPAESA